MNAFSCPAEDFETYIDESPYNFYVRYVFPKLKVTDWKDGKLLNGRSKQPRVCGKCFLEDTKRLEDYAEFKRTQARRSLKAFDPFGGVGAFALAMEETGCIKMTHAVEISPSAAKTMK